MGCGLRGERFFLQTIHFYHQSLSFSLPRAPHSTSSPMRPPCSRLDATVSRPSAAPLRRAPELAQTSIRPLSMPPRKSTSSTATTSALPAAAPWFEAELGERVVSEKVVSSSSWATAYKYETESGKAFFVKTSLGRDEMFKTEAAGLAALAAAAAASSSAAASLVIPKPLHAGTLPEGEGGSFIVMEHLDLGGGRGGKGLLSQEELGVALARLHLAPPASTSSSAAAAAPRFGFEVDNFIGGTPQPNGWSDSWVDFYREKRLGHMLRLVGERLGSSEVDRMGKKLCDKLELFFDDVDDGGGKRRSDNSVPDPRRPLVRKHSDRQHREEGREELLCRVVDPRPGTLLRAVRRSLLWFFRSGGEKGKTVFFFTPCAHLSFSLFLSLQSLVTRQSSA